MRKRNKGILIRMLPKERKQLEMLAKKEKTSMSDVVRNRIMNTKVIPKPSEFYLELEEKIHAIGIEINNIAHKANTVGFTTPEEVNYVMELQQKIIDIIKNAKFNN